MPNNIIIHPKALAIATLATLAPEIGSFVVKIPEALLMEAQWPG